MSQLTLAPAKIVGSIGLTLLTMSGAPAAQSAGGEPLSAIDWLSDSVAPEANDTQPTPVTPPTQQVPSLTVAPLESNVADRTGVFDGAELGLAAGLWSQSSASELAQRLYSMPSIALPSLRSFYADLMAARFEPPADAIIDESFFLARVDTLMGLARFETATTLLQEAGNETPERFRRYFDIGLLTGEEGSACRIIEETPEVSPSFPARIFCLARNGEWDVAALTLGTAEALGILTDQEDQLLMRFLDPDLFEGEEVPAVSSMSPLLFRLYESIGERPATENLPVAFAIVDLTENVGWKDRLRAAERLTGVGAMRPGDFLKIVKERQPAASGGVWTRVDALQDFAATTPSNDLAAELSAAWDAAREGGYGAELAPWFLSRIRAAELARDAQHSAFEIALFAGETDVAAQWTAGRAGDADLLAVATGLGTADRSSDPLSVAIRQSLAGLPPRPEIRRQLEDGRTGAALLEAIAVLAAGAEGDPRSVGDALAVLVSLGLEDLARRVSVELLLDVQRI